MKAQPPPDRGSQDGRLFLGRMQLMIPTFRDISRVMDAKLLHWLNSGPHTGLFSPQPILTKRMREKTQAGKAN